MKYLDSTNLSYLWNKIKANFTNVIESISVNGTRQSVTNKNVNIEIPQSMPLTDVDSTPTCNSCNLVTSGGVYNFVGTQIGTKAEDTTVVHKAGTESITGNKTFSGTTTFSGATNLGSNATATTPAATDNATSVATTAFVKTAISGKQDKVTSSTDNAVVRFNGTTGNIQNSGVTINDSNQVTAAKFITSGGTSSQFVKGDGSLDSTAYAPKASPTLTGTPLAPTAASGTKTNQIATTCFVQKAVAGYQTALSGGCVVALCSGKINLVGGTCNSTIQKIVDSSSIDAFIVHSCLKDVAIPTVAAVQSMIGCGGGGGGGITGTGVTAIVALTQAQYDALVNKDCTTLYVIKP